jgi:transglutaminase-like putative cysteine protease
MNRRESFSAIAGLFTLFTGCAGLRENPMGNRIGNPLQVAGLYHPTPRVVEIAKNSIQDIALPFDDAFNIARKIIYKSEPPFTDHMQTPEETVRLRTGDCEDFAVYLSKLLTENRIYNEIIFGQGHISDGFVLHGWNRAYLGMQGLGIQRFTLDAVAGLRILESEVPAGYYREYCSYHQTDYSDEGIRKMEKYLQGEERLAAFRNTVTGDPKKRIFEWRKIG